MFSRKLFKTILLDPAKAGADELNIISGYATSAMAFHHLNTIKAVLSKDIKVNLIVGMGIKDGLSKSNHLGFKKVMDEYESFICRYRINSPAVHSKVYSWCKNKKPFAGFVGSANYTQTAFYEKQGECLAKADPELCQRYFNQFIKDTIACTHRDVESKIQIYPDAVFARFKHPSQGRKPVLPKAGHKPRIAGVPYVRVSLLDNNHTLPTRSGLNWGQRPELHRDPDQAYIRLPAAIYKTDFFPARALHFTVHTDDGKILTCSRAQENGKAIHTPYNNSLLGRYFRRRLGLANGQLVKKGDLLRYGRSSIDFYKIEDETYYMDFSKPS
ncbi:MAG: restriction endonuclease PLD domain-containing protein [Candidatus Margulisiibacteriota bacterium]